MPAPDINDTQERVMQVIQDNFGDETEVTLASRFREDLDADSLDVIEIVMDLEEEFDVTIFHAEADEAKFQTVGDVVQALHAKLVAEAAGN